MRSNCSIVAVEVPNYSTETIDYTPADSLEDEMEETSSLEDDSFTSSTGSYSDYAMVPSAAVVQRALSVVLIAVSFSVGYALRQQN